MQLNIQVFQKCIHLNYAVMILQVIPMGKPMLIGSWLFLLGSSLLVIAARVEMINQISLTSLMHWSESAFSL